jgi:hypothetical protein
MKIPYLAKTDQEDIPAWGWAYIEEAEPEQTGPEIPYEVWNTRPIDAERCMAAVRAMGRAPA